MVKINLKDASLWFRTELSVSSNFSGGFTGTIATLLPTIQTFTAPFIFSKVTKSITQFVHQLGVYLIYLNDLMLAAPSKGQTSQQFYDCL